jgi:hypothetical protein
MFENLNSVIPWKLSQRNVYFNGRQPKFGAHRYFSADLTIDNQRYDRCRAFGREHGAIYAVRLISLAATESSMPQEFARRASDRPLFWLVPVPVPTFFILLAVGPLCSMAAAVTGETERKLSPGGPEICFSREKAG